MAEPETSDLRVAAEQAIAAGEETAAVNTKALLTLCRSESWAHASLIDLGGRDA